VRAVKVLDLAAKGVWSTRAFWFSVAPAHIHPCKAGGRKWRPGFFPSCFHAASKMVARLFSFMLSTIFKIRGIENATDFGEGY
jgi:hypothetical protein